MSRTKEQMQLIEEIGIGLEERMKLSPLASRIYALLILSSYKGLTFEEIRETIQASKSSTSVNIKVLVQLEYIRFYTKAGDRKRYFKLTKYSQLTTLQSYLQTIDNEKIMIEKINIFNKNYHPEKFTNEQSLGEIFQDYLSKKRVLVEDTIKKMAHFRESENL